MQRLFLFLLALPLFGQVAAVDLGATSSISGNSQCFPNQGSGGGSDYANYGFTSLCQYTLAPWSSAATDTKRNRLVFQGGGHSDYYGNELYALSISGNTGTMTRITNPSVWNSDIFSASTLTNTYKNVDGTPVARHGFGGVAYLPAQDAMFDLGTGYPNGLGASFTWTFTMADNTWHAKDPTVTGACTIAGASATGVSITSAAAGWMVAYDSVKQTIWADNIVVGILYEYDPTTNCYAQRSNAFPTDQGTTAVIDPVRRKLFSIGNNAAGTGVQIGVVDISGADATYAYADITSSTTGCSGIGGSGNTFAWPGVVYDPVLGKIVIYPNFGNTLYIFDPGTYVCSIAPFDPPSVPSLGASQEGTFGKFAYLNGKYVIANWFNNHAFSFTLNANSIPGMGSTALTCLDVDGDGYGVGPGCTAPDADDFDSTVHTAAQAISKWGTLAAFLGHQGYTPANLWYLSTAGTDAGSPANCKNTIGSPCLTFAYIFSHGFAAGDAILVRSGTFTNLVVAPPSGTAGHPTIIMPYPGEQYFIDNTGAGFQTSVDLTGGKSWVVIEGGKFAGGLGNTGCIGGGNVTNNIIIRHTETTLCTDGGIDAFDGLSDWTVEYNVAHDFAGGICGSCQHAMYLGSRGNPSTNVAIRRNLMYNPNGYPALQWNGRGTNVVIEQNVIYNTPGATGITIFNGMKNSRVQGNQIFNNAAGINLVNYDGNCYDNTTPQNVCPYDQTGNLFENNTIYVGYDPGTGSGSGLPALEVANLSTTCPPPYGAGTTYATGTTIIYPYAAAGAIQYTSRVNGNIGNQPDTHPTQWTAGSGCTLTKTGNMGSNTFRNNLFAAANSGNLAAGPLLFPLCTEQHVIDNSCTLDAGDTSLSTSTFQNNDFYVYSGGTSNVIQTGPITSGYTGHTIAQMNSGSLWAAASASNLTSDPSFTAVNPSYYNAPASFNLRLLSGSSSSAAGSTTGTPTFDLLGTMFTAATPSLGVFQFSGVSGGSSITAPLFGPIAIH